LIAPKAGLLSESTAEKVMAKEIKRARPKSGKKIPQWSQEAFQRKSAEIVKKYEKKITLASAKRVPVILPYNAVERSIDDGQNENHVSHNLVMHKHQTVGVNGSRILKIEKKRSEAHRGRKRKNSGSGLAERIQGGPERSDRAGGDSAGGPTAIKPGKVLGD
jgi:hypothetical protein